MKFLIVLGMFACLGTVQAYAFDPPTTAFPQKRSTIQPRIPDLVPGDGIADGGSLSNPYILEGRDGTSYKIKPSIPDIFPHDGVLDAGTVANPWVIESE